MKTILAILLAMLIAVSGSSAIDEETLLKDLTPDKESVATFIEDNFSLFVQKCNETSEDGNVWDATGVESKQIITVYTTDSVVEGLFLDFSEDDGYAILADDYIMYDFQTEGESPFIEKDTDEILFSVVTGYYYIIDGEIKSVNEIDEIEEETEIEDDSICSSSNDNSNATNMSTIYNPSTNAFCNADGFDCYGCIINPTVYVKNKYGEEFELYDSSSIIYYFNEKMSSLSAYNERPGSGEGNCYWFSMYFALQYYADNFYSYNNIGTNTMPSSTSTINYNPKNSEPNTYYSIYNKKTGKNTSIYVLYNGKWVHRLEVINNLNFPELWCSVREEVDKLYTRGMIKGVILVNAKQPFINVLDNITNRYGITIDSDYYNLWLGSALTCVDDIVKSNNMFIVYTNRDSIYGTHAMAGVGYAIYRKQTTKWKMTITTYKYLLEVNNGWVSGFSLDGRCYNTRFYDASQSSFSAIRFLYAN